MTLARITAPAVALAGLLAAGCGHAHSVGQPDEPPAKTADAADATAARPPTTVPKHQRATPESDIEIASTPAALLREGGARAIQDRLARSGELEGDPSGELDGPTRAALTRFQRAHDLPGTGIPDDATVRKLGLKVEDVFAAGGDRGKRQQACGGSHPCP